MSLRSSGEARRLWSEYAAATKRARQSSRDAGANDVDSALAALKDPEATSLYVAHRSETKRVVTHERYPGCECAEEDYTEGYEGPAPCEKFEPLEGRAYRMICKTCDHWKDCHG